MAAIGLAHAATDTGDGMAGIDEHGGEITADMPGSANDKDAHFLNPPTTPACALPGASGCIVARSAMH